MINKVFNEDCLVGMQRIPSGSVDMVLCDLPQRITQNKWDTIIAFEPMWEQYLRIVKDNGAIVLFANGMFTADLMQSNRKLWKYNLVWDKVLTSGFLNANKMPLRQHEDICVFYRKQPTYNPQKTVGKSKNHSKGKMLPVDDAGSNYGFAMRVDNAETLGNLKHPTSIQRFSKPHPSVSQHPTQKSLDHYESLIRTYTNPGDTVLDNCMGSGTTAVACVNTGRNYIGFELDKGYYDIINERLASLCPAM